MADVRVSWLEIEPSPAIVRVAWLEIEEGEAAEPPPPDPVGPTPTVVVSSASGGISPRVMRDRRGSIEARQMMAKRSADALMMLVGEFYASGMFDD